MAKIVYKNETIHVNASYDQLSNKPSINGHELESGDNSASSLGIVWHGTQEQFDALATHDPDCIYFIQQINSPFLIADISGNKINQYQLKKDTNLNNNTQLIVDGINEAFEKLGNMSGQTKSLVQNLNEIAETLGDFNKLKTSNKDRLVFAVNEINESFGDRSNLLTNNKDSLVAAINETNSQIGDLLSLTTTKKDKIVNAINEVNAGVGSPSALTTLAKSNMVQAINELDKDIGNRTQLTTTKKDNLVNAVNEHDAQIGDIKNLTTSKKDTLVNAINSCIGGGSAVDQTKTLTVTMTPSTQTGVTIQNTFARYIAKDIVYVEFEVKNLWSIERSDGRQPFATNMKIDNRAIKNNTGTLTCSPSTLSGSSQSCIMNAFCDGGTWYFYVSDGTYHMNKTVINVSGILRLV